MMYHPDINTTQSSLSSDGQVHQPTTLFNNHNHPTSMFDDISSASLFHLPSPCIQYEDALYELTWKEMHDLYFHQQDLTMVHHQTASDMRDLKSVDANKEIEQHYTKVQEATAKRRTSKKDRHSKIKTSQGLRDRRMRLSLPVAQKFFALQDMLGFDKASKTIEWLLMQSSSAIKLVMRGLQPTKGTRTCSAGAANSITSTSECEVNSGTSESTNNENLHVGNSMERKMKPISKEGKREKTALRGASDQLVRESRKLARERARKRTMEKRIVGKSNMLAGEMNLESWSQFKIAEESGNVMAFQGLKEMEDLSSLVIANQWSTPEQHQYGGFLWQ